MNFLTEQLADAAFNGDLAAGGRLLSQGADVEVVCAGMPLLAHSVDILIDGSMRRGEPIVAASTVMFRLCSPSFR